jgi:hypothetical protein
MARARLHRDPRHRDQIVMADDTDGGGRRRVHPSLPDVTDLRRVGPAGPFGSLLREI